LDQWIEGVYRITGNPGKGGDADACFLIDCGDEFTLIETGRNEFIGKEVIRVLNRLGHNPEALTHIILTHSHPEILGGLSYLHSRTQAKIMIHEAAKPVFEEGRSYVLEKQFPLKETGAKLALAWKSSLFGNYVGLPKPDEISFLQGGEDLQIGESTFIIDKTGGHSSDSILIHAYNQKATFIGDELGIYDNNEYSFFFDLTGSPERRRKALRVCSKLKTGFIFPTHLSPIEQGFIDQDVEHAILAQQHFETTLSETLLGFDSARLDKIVDHVHQILHLKWQTPYKELKVGHSTILRYLELFKNEEKVIFDPKTKKYSYNRESLDDDYDPYAAYES
jgi:glyoxylase-like metal-dependent hydrolase (beta-lactamase superfamily II)